MTHKVEQDQRTDGLDLEVPIRLARGQAHALAGAMDCEHSDDPLCFAAESLATSVDRISKQFQQIQWPAGKAPAAVDLEEPIDELERAAAILAAVYDQACLNGPDVVEPPAIMAALRLVRSGLTKIGEAS